MNTDLYPNVTVLANQAETNRVLRNTYALLALSMIPTVLGAWIGVSTGILSAMSPMASMLVFFVGAFGLMFAIEKTKNSSTGVFVLLGFTFFMGLMLSRMIGLVLHMRGGAEIVMLAFASTAAVFLAMATLSSVIKRDLSGMGKFLMIGAVLVMVAGIANVFLQSGAMMITISVLVAGIFSAFILHDLKAVRDGYETNYISATLNVYLDLYNVFQSLLALLGIFGGRDE
ncbi:MAG: Bax inhibitor-1 family protein [Paucibacter sp.]|nr:Bax inhibitor-1 family protein [Roseateles sp.]